MSKFERIGAGIGYFSERLEGNSGKAASNYLTFPKMEGPRTVESGDNETDSCLQDAKARKAGKRYLTFPRYFVETYPQGAIPQDKRSKI
jgi:hypothetical protein